MTQQELLQAAWKAILRGDYAERDRLCALAKAKIDEREHGKRIVDAWQTRPIQLVEQPDGSYLAPQILPRRH